MSKQKFKFGDAVRVWWTDSREMPGWQYEPTHRASEIGHIVTLGYFVAQDANSLTIAHSIETHRATLGTLHIPKGAIAKIDRFVEGSR